METHRLSAEITDFERQAGWSMHDPGYKALVRDREQRRKERSLGQARYEEKSERAGTLVAIRSRIDDWRRANTHSIIVPHARPAPRLGKSEFPAAAVTRVRQTLQAARGERATVANAPATSAEAKAAARAFVAETGALARPDVSALMGGTAHVFFPAIGEVPMPGITLSGFGMTQRGGRVRDGLALWCWLQPDAVIAALDREIEAAADDGRAMTVEAKAARLAELDDAILSIERDEVAFIAMAEAQGATVNHRRDVDPRALLGVVVADADGVLAA